MKTNKYEYLWIVQGNYGYGWNDLTASELYIEAKGDLKIYRENETYAFHRLIQRRELKGAV